MGAHVRNTMPPQHIRTMPPTMPEQPSEIEKFAHNFVDGCMQRIGYRVHMTHKQSLGCFIAGILLTLLLVYIFAVYKGMVKNPFKSMGTLGTNVSPTSNLQYFFF